VRTFLLQLAESDSLAESGLKVIGYFDALVEHRATLEACVRAAAALSQCVAGLRDSTSPAYVRFNRRGLLLDGPAAPTTSRVVRIGDRSVGEVWLERGEGPAPLDELVVERLALAAGVLWRVSPRPSRSTAGLIELVVSTRSTPEDRDRALELLGLSSERPVDVAAVAGADADRLATGLASVHQSFLQAQPADSQIIVRSALVGDVGVVLAQPTLRTGAKPDAAGPQLADLEAALVVGMARGRTVAEVANAWRQAQTAIRFSGLLGCGNVVDYDQLGSLALLADLPRTIVESNPDVRAVAALASTSRGLDMVETLQQRLTHGSIRGAAAALYLHHSSVRYRLRQAEESLGLELDDPRSRLRAELALVLWRLSRG
jgi:hypothetical protein